MAVTKRGADWYVYFRPFKDKKIGVRLDTKSKAEAKGIETMLIRACRTGDYTGLDPVSREVYVRMFANQGWELPQGLGGRVVTAPTAELVLWKACELFLTYPTIKDCKAKQRYIYSLQHFVEKWGKEQVVKDLWVPALRLYQNERQKEGAAPTTINWELATLSKMFGVLQEMQLVEANPCRLLKQLSAKSSERDVYLSFQDVQGIVEHVPLWTRPVILMAYYAGMRRGEILGLTWKQVDLAGRMIRLGAEDTKEGRKKRVPLREEVIAVLEDCRRVRNLQTDRVFLINGRPPSSESTKNPWRKACKAIGLTDPRPRLHDLRHSWRTNAARSGMDPEIAELVLGHWFRGKTVTERYRRINDEEMIRAVDAMTFDHGNTEIFVAGRS